MKIGIMSDRVIRIVVSLIISFEEFEEEEEEEEEVMQIEILIEVVFKIEDVLGFLFIGMFFGFKENGDIISNRL